MSVGLRITRSSVSVTVCFAVVRLSIVGLGLRSVRRGIVLILNASCSENRRIASQSKWGMIQDQSGRSTQAWDRTRHKTKNEIGSVAMYRVEMNSVVSKYPKIGFESSIGTSRT